ncbi:DUF1376 domain-containing protein [Moraxella porci]|uniref:DUF1376 domain-containing protein n=1 Tax=Moraxella porci TaxID=1288392 RepID=UPI00244BAA45|nr:DUF1376 domain-containing protein [Moraxella porci]MDH2272975.1 DUF1376 domain-containing protein [Moraxella porci]
MMHKVLHNFGDWELETRHMTRIEKSIYFDARTLYLKEGKPLTDDLPLLERLLSCNSDDEKQALAFVLSHKFTHDKKGGRYKHHEWDVIIKNYRYAHRNDVTTNANDVTHDATVHNSDVTQNDRVKALRNRKKLMINALKNVGVNVNSRTKTTDLQALCEQHSIDITNLSETVHNSDVTHDVTTNANDVTHDATQNDVKNHAITINQEPLTKNQDINNISTVNHEKTKRTSSGKSKTLNVSFDVFWDAYDKKIDPKKCEPLWRKLNDQDRLEIMAYIPKYKLSQPDKQFRKNPQTFLNSRSWESEIIDSQTSQPNRQGNQHATHQRTLEINPAEEYYNNAMAEYERYYGSASQPTTGQGFTGNVYDVETAI